ncbi:hypothetical protein PV327_001024 [Microctonus hyperodae]|uniref:Uncharacterized protein n=1 Tax=Microctonus hyperodae TaxID=165561 RepID=A0AA39G994_MICHY|nr:hypothetical protein PV327_001024 [Microctonus hyperodae]
MAIDRIDHVHICVDPFRRQMRKEPRAKEQERSTASGHCQENSQAVCLRMQPSSFQIGLIDKGRRGCLMSYWKGQNSRYLILQEFLVNNFTAWIYNRARVIVQHD